jgi:hypothetical protein
MAAKDFHINGPTVIKWGASTANTDIAYTDNDDLVRITVRDHYRTFTRNDTGDMIAEGVHAGSTATIDFTAAAWDDNQLWSLLSKARVGTITSAVASEGAFATVGAPIVNGSAPCVFALAVVPTNPGAVVYTFPKVMLSAGPEYIDLGNSVKRIALTFTTVAPASGTTIITTTAVPSGA